MEIYQTIALKYQRMSFAIHVTQDPVHVHYTQQQYYNHNQHPISS